MPWRILAVGVDTSLPSLSAARVAGELARRLGAEIVLISVIDRTKAIGDIDAGIGIEEARMVVRREAEQALEQAKAEVGDVPLRTMLIEGEPKHEILRAADHVGADAIVVGTHGRKGIARLVEGSVSEYILRHSSVPVIVVPHAP
ncbi:MAG: universal stress protein [Bacteroidota bacterium]|nr:universal stress protein [Candidatus Kapabacteria bacterium]MDW8272444.1 universal stress protein [Bacteroidota bacterium]